MLPKASCAVSSIEGDQPDILFIFNQHRLYAENTCPDTMPGFPSDDDGAPLLESHIFKLIHSTQQLGLRNAVLRRMPIAAAAEAGWSGAAALADLPHTP